MSESKSAYGRGFAIRLTLLLALLAGVAGLFYYEKNIGADKHSKKLDALFDFLNKNSEGTSRELTREQVQQHVGFAPSLSEPRGKYEVDRYSFRTLPFLPGQHVYVVFENKYYCGIATTNEKDVTAEKLTENARFKPGVRADVIPAPAIPNVAGGAPPGPATTGPGDDDGSGEINQSGADQDAGNTGDEAGEGESEPAGGDDGDQADGTTGGDTPKSGDGAPAGDGG